MEILVCGVIFLGRDGRPLYFKQYEKVWDDESRVLVSGLISAIQSTSRVVGEERVKQIMFENRTFHFWEENNVIAAVSTMQALDESDVQVLLQELLKGFLSRYKGVIEGWNGDTQVFADADGVVEPIIKNFEQKYDFARKRCAMILTTGTTPDPLIRTIKHFHPEYVCFLSSKDVIVQLSKVLNETLSEQYSYEFLQIKDINDLTHCLDVAEQAFNKLFEKGFRAGNIYIDITGGTKPMSAGLTMAAVKYYSPIVYVGGERRGEDGRVIGPGEIYPAYNPYEFFALKRIERGLELFNDYRWRAAVEVFGEAYKNLGGGKVRRLASIFLELTIAYASWDRFLYRGAVQILDRVRNEISSFCEIQGSEALEELCRQIEINLGALKVLDSRGKAEGLAPQAIVDMFSNALRRAKELNYDDATTRIYRLTEMLAQNKLQEIIKKADLDPNRIPDRGLADTLSQMKDQKGKNKLELKKLYDLLNILDNDTMKVDLRNKLLDVLQQMRDHSILAHGASTITAESFEGLKKLAEKLLKVEIAHFEETLRNLQFPQLNKNFKTYLGDNK